VIRILHFSDVHVQEPVTTMPVHEFMTKRALAAVNLWVSRGRLFREVPQKLEALARFATSEGVNVAMCTGDYTALGTEAEHASARRAIEPFRVASDGYVTVPGNHDLYLPDAVRAGRFEKHFGDLLRSDLPELVVDGAYPWVRLIGEQLALIGVNSAHANPNPFSSAGRIPDAQLEALGRVLDDARVRERFVVVMTHYGILRKGGHPDAPHHGLKNADELMRVCNRPRLMVCHGHIHHRYAHAPADGRPWLFCAGSATQRGREGAWLYELSGEGGRALPVRFENGRYLLDPSGAIAIH
jgi:3',5'-cyclic AMP phosphodiesterase CpdA